MEQICPEHLCTACSACYNVCPKHAITMAEVGATGYVYPQIDASKCIDCKFCQKVCPVVNPVAKHKPLQAFAAISKDKEMLDKSASGGAAASIGRAIIERGGIVYGCRMKSYTDIAHRRFSTLKEMYAMRGSKYVQSSIGTVYQQVKKDLEGGLSVLFTGTACQVGGLRNYLRKEYGNLYCLDLVCHGVPSQKLLRNNVEMMFRKKGLRPKGTERVEFRRIFSSQTSNLDLRYGTFVESAIPSTWQQFGHNSYITAFMYGLIFRENCYQCPYACAERTADVTVADFWGYKGKLIPRGKGISLIMPSTEKGSHLIEMIRPYMQMEERAVAEAVNGNGQLQHPSKRPSERDTFLDGYERKGENVFAPLLVGYKRQCRINKIKGNIIELIAKNPTMYQILKSVYYKLKQICRK